MKFAKELDESAIPEWRDKYFDYKGAKKKLKAVGRSVRNVERSSPNLSRKSPFGNVGSVRDAPVYSFLQRAAGGPGGAGDGRGGGATAGVGGGSVRDDGYAQDDNRLHPLRNESAGGPTGSGGDGRRSPQYPKGDAADNDNERTPRQRPLPVANERSPLRTDERRSNAPDGQPRLARYGSIIGSPPSGNSPLPDISPQKTQASLLELPDPALTPADQQNSQISSPPVDLGPSATLDGHTSHLHLDTPEISELRHPDSTRRQFAHTGNAYSIEPSSDEVAAGNATKKTQLTRHTSLFNLPHKRASSVPEASKGAGPRPLMQRVLSVTSNSNRNRRTDSNNRKRQLNDVALESYREADFRQADFFLFLDKQLDKIEGFYKAKENEATNRLTVLREQLHVLRNRRLEEIIAEEQQQQLRRSREQERQHEHDAATRTRKNTWERQYLENGGSLAYSPGHNVSDRRAEEATPVDPADNAIAGNGSLQPPAADREPGNGGQPDEGPRSHRWASVASQVNDKVNDTLHASKIGKTSKAMNQLSTPPNQLFRQNPSNLDYTRRKRKEEAAVPAYRAAKRKLKTALQEYYRGLELLKSYALLNRTAFRKINKKYDKTVSTPPGGTMRYMSEKVNRAHFVNSDLVDTYLQTIEDLYARYFERGNRKVAVGKLRGKVMKLGDYTGAFARMGLCLGAGCVLGVQGLVYGILDLYDDGPTVHIWASYLLQIYAGYFLFLLLTGLFCIDARIFSRAKVNYQFVFEFDARHTLDWRQLCEIPSVFFFVLALLMYLNFTLRLGGETMYIWYPVILVGLSIIIMCLPPPLFYWEARKWFLYSLWRLLLAGIYPVEFRDFFLGDMFCSETYAMGNIELFFCAYSVDWRPGQLPTCSSSSSRWLGWLSTVPGIIRALQCIRRFGDTRSVFPHLVNCGKYMFTIAQYATLSAFRINKTYEMRALFITCATINAIYCSIWDIGMDWSLGSWNSKHPLLRDTLAYKRHMWFYYMAMIIDPILRFNWVFYAIFADEKYAQHSSVISFAVAFSEVVRRGIWVVIRVENEHCTNVSKNRAARDVELPYERTSDELISTEQFDGSGGEVQDATGDSVAAEESGRQPRQRRPDTEMAASPELGRTTSHTTGRAPATGTTTSSTTPVLRQRRQHQEQSESPLAQALRRVGSTIATAHSQDYEKKRKPLQDTQEERESDEDDGDDDEEDEEETHEAEELADQARRTR